MMPLTSITKTGGVYNPPTAGNGGINGAEAAQIDLKLDDGLPNTGIVLATNSVTLISATGQAASTHASAATAGDCVIAASTGLEVAATYNGTPSSTTTYSGLNCAMLFRF
jgi:hypothetical protein